jgi:uncharacterized membrane protein YkvA (DUF1232 family)
MIKRLIQAWHVYRKLLREPKASPWLKWLPVILVVYVIWPLDFIPDIFPLIGQLDDVAVIVSIGLWLWKQIAPHVPKDHGSHVIDVQAVKSRKQ